MSKIFISYRRDDTAGYAGRLYDRLSRHFGKDQVFMDVDHIEPGEDFVELINEKVRACNTLIALIGRNWVNAADKKGARRLDDPEDFVRLEITSALAGKVRVMPVLVGDASMPDAQQLPEPLATLCRRQAAEVSDTRFHQDVDRLIQSIEKSTIGDNAAIPPQPSDGVESMQSNIALLGSDKPSELPGIKEPRPETSFLHYPRGKLRRLLVWTAPLVLLAAAGLGYWDSYYRPHYEYYANVITRWGLPEGIGELTVAQMHHRNSTLQFTRNGRRGPIQEVRIVNSQGQYPPVFASSGFLLLDRLMPLAGATRASGFSLPTGMVARRVVFERSHDGRILAQRAYNASNRLLYALQYLLDGNVAKFGDGPFAEAIRESGITHIKFVRANTGAESGLDKEIHFRDGSGKPNPDPEGSYGLRYTFDSRGSIVEEIKLDQKGNPAPDNLGIAKVVYAHHDTWGNRIRIKNLSRDNQPAIESMGIAEIAMTYDVYGNLNQVAFLGKDGRLTTQRNLGAAIRTIAYDDQGNIVENTFRDANQKLVTGVLGFAKQKVQWDKRGRSWETFFGPDDKPVLIQGRAVALLGTWDERGNPVSFEYFDEHNRPTRDSNGCTRFTSVHDEGGNVTEQACFDEIGRPIRNMAGWSKVKIANDDRGNAIEMRYFGSEDQPELYEERLVRVVLKYNEQGKKSEEAYFDVANRPVKNKSGYAKVIYEYNAQGKLIQVSFFDESGLPTPRKGGYAKIMRVYDARGNMTEESLFDSQGKPTTDEEDGYSRAKFKYDDRGYRTETAYFDTKDRLTLCTEGYARTRSKYNDKGQIIEQVFLGLDDAMIAQKWGYAKRRWTFDERGNVSQLAYFGKNDQLVRNTLGYATIRYSYDSLSRESKREFFDVNGAPVRTMVIIDKLEPGSSGQRSTLQVRDQILTYEGQNVPDTRVFYELELMRGERSREIRVQRDGKLLNIDIPAGRLRGLETVDKISPEARKTGA